jgi:hypothetical protein
MPSGRRQGVLLLAVLTLAGCTTPVHKGKSPLAPAQMWSDSVALDVFFVRYPFGDPAVNEKLWEAVDEQQFSPELRDRLTRNGFRAGLVSGQMPLELSRLLKLSDKPPPDGQASETKLDSLQAQPMVICKHLQLRAGDPSQLVASGIYSELPVLLCEPGQLCGEPYSQAQGILSVKSLPQPDGRVRLEIVPELHHGQPRMSYVYNQGVLRQEVGKPKRVFDDMTLSADLSNGDMLILSSLSNRPGSLGHHFFTENDGRLEQKLLIVRLAQTQHDGLFTLKLDE